MCAQGDTPLICACRGGHSEIVLLLLVSGADPSQKNTVTGTCLLLQELRLSVCCTIEWTPLIRAVAAYCLMHHEQARLHCITRVSGAMRWPALSSSSTTSNSRPSRYHSSLDIITLHIYTQSYKCEHLRDTHMWPRYEAQIAHLDTRISWWA